MTIGRDGAVLITDDVGNVIWRLTGVRQGEASLYRLRIPFGHHRSGRGSDLHAEIQLCNFGMSVNTGAAWA